MDSSQDIVDLFFYELKSYNSNNFSAIKNADLTYDNIKANKAFSSIVTRYFIFVDKHPEFSPSDVRFLFYQLKIDLIAKYFSLYPDNSDPSALEEFQQLLIFYNKRMAQHDKEILATG